MPFSINDIRFHYSGGAANSDPSLSLGGVISSAKIVSQSVSAPVNITGLSGLSAQNNAQGVGVLSWSSATNTMSWQPPGSVATYSQSITADGTYTIGGTDGTVTLTATFASLPATYKQDSLTVTNSNNNVFDSVSAMDSLVGDVEYRCIYLKNNGTVTVNDVKLWIKTLTTGPDELDIGLDPAGVGDGSATGVATTVANESTAPAGVTFSRPTSYVTGLSVGTLLAGQCIALWERRTVDAGTTGNVTANKSTIAAAVTV